MKHCLLFGKLYGHPEAQALRLLKFIGTLLEWCLWRLWCAGGGRDPEGIGATGGRSGRRGLPSLPSLSNLSNLSSFPTLSMRALH